MSLRVIPCTAKAGRAWVRRVHSHLDAPPGALAAVAVAEDDRMVCVAMLARPTARMLQRFPACAEVNRVASDGTAEHAASKGQWSCPSRRRAPAEQPGRKVRWEFGATAMPRDPEVDRLVREHAGKVEIPRRRADVLPLFAGAEP